jgi:predicted SnoaL-like aldol condensation-catalyzing enzyme
MRLRLLACAAIAAAGLTGAAMVRDRAMAESTPQEQLNIKTVLALYEAALNKNDFEEASKYLGKRYTQHNPTAEDGPEGLKKFIEWRKKAIPNAKSIVKRAWADGDFVILHVHSIREPGTRGVAIVDIYKLEDGKVVEHWDVIQEVPDPETAKNKNGMF